jgi:hypothetical protein
MISILIMEYPEVLAHNIPLRPKCFAEQFVYESPVIYDLSKYCPFILRVPVAIHRNIADKLCFGVAGWLVLIYGHCVDYSSLSPQLPINSRQTVTP